MTLEQRREAAQFLARARLSGPPTPSPPDDLTPASIVEGYALQDAVHAALERAGFGARVGHKIGCTTAVMQAYLSIDHPCAGEVFATTVFEGSAELPLARYHRIGVECEIAARLAADLPARDGGHTRDSVAGAVGALMAGIELVDDRYVDYPSLSAPTLIADDFFNAGVVLGPEVTAWRDLDLEAIAGAMIIDGAEVGRGRGADILGHPLNALAWLADHRAARGVPLRAGEFVMLGSVVKTVFIDAPASVRVRFDGLGEAAVRFV
ncbi:MAG: fumarylacetoacetate hydrolase family protein [Alphaproteobacteria bacterium]|nr:fumarylacetoacetate hydrolase family protein [Alphaproteobacteria bacterium]